MARHSGPLHLSQERVDAALHPLAAAGQTLGAHSVSVEKKWLTLQNFPAFYLVMAGKRAKPTAATVVIDKTTHDRISDHCRKHGLKIGHWASQILEKAISTATN